MPYADPTSSVAVASRKRAQEKYASKNRNVLSKRSRDWQLKDIEAYREADRNRKKAAYPRRKSIITNNGKRLRHTSINHRIKHNLKSRMWQVLNGIPKDGPCMSLVGCGYDSLISHLESMFVTGMSWDNYGFGRDKWHIDHIRPLDSFDFSIIGSQQEAFHYTNLQPLWQFQNLSKKNKWNG